MGENTLGKHGLLFENKKHVQNHCHSFLDDLTKKTLNLLSFKKSYTSVIRDFDFSTMLFKVTTYYTIYTIV